MFDNQNNVISVKNLSKSYKSVFGFKREKILKNIDLDVGKNSITVILGPNGSGKTTFINIITGITFEYEFEETTNFPLNLRSNRIQGQSLH